MSTRSFTIFESDIEYFTENVSGELCRFYRHCDGYPEGHWLPIYVWDNRMGFRCGYVAIPESHPLCGVDYDDVPEDVICCVHGGLTYSGNLRGEVAWAFGFDCGHLGDAPDDSIASNELPPRASYVWDGLYVKAHVWKLNEVIKECGKLAEKLSDVF